MLKPTLCPGSAVCRPWWCISMDLTSAVSLAGENIRVIPGLRTPVSILPTGTVPTPGSRNREQGCFFPHHSVTQLETGGTIISLTSNFVNVLQRQSQGLVDGSHRWLDGVQNLEESFSTGISFSSSHFPSLEPGHLHEDKNHHFMQFLKYFSFFFFFCTFWVAVIMFSPVQPETGTKGTA